MFNGIGDNGVESNNTHGRTTINTVDYLQALTVSKEGEIEMEIRTWRGIRWISVYLHIDVGSAAISTTRINFLLSTKTRKRRWSL